MKIYVTTVRNLNAETLPSYCQMLREIGVPVLVVRELLNTGKGEWTTTEPDGGIVTTRYEIEGS